jgi:hypothetical protein
LGKLLATNFGSCKSAALQYNQQPMSSSCIQNLTTELIAHADFLARVINHLQRPLQTQDTCRKVLDVSSALWQAHYHPIAALSELGTVSCTANRLQPDSSRARAGHRVCNA